MTDERFMRHHYGASGYVKPPRDPRKDPIPGDCLRDGFGQIRAVRALADGPWNGDQSS
jgi:hypothetical protein